MDQLIQKLEELARKLHQDSAGCRHVNDSMRLTLMSRANDLDEIVKRLKALGQSDLDERICG